MNARPRILFLCAGNSCRSQMAEGWTRHLHGGRYQTFSAGSAPQERVDPRAVIVMREAGVDISAQFPKPIASLAAQRFDYVITLCGEEAETCPWFPGQAIVLHQGFDDPPHQARAARSEEEALAPYRRVRDEIKAFVQELPGWLDAQGRSPLAPKINLSGV